jgi:hypothetical protein
MENYISKHKHPKLKRKQEQIEIAKTLLSLKKLKLNLKSG